MEFLQFDFSDVAETYGTTNMKIGNYLIRSIRARSVFGLKYRLIIHVTITAIKESWYLQSCPNYIFEICGGNISQRGNNKETDLIAQLPRSRKVPKVIVL